jgi:hypothetical protein
MPDTPQLDTPDLFAILADVRHILSNSVQLTGYALDLKASADRLLPLVGEELRRARRVIDQVLPLLPLAAILLLPGCMLDLNKLATDLKKPDVTFARSDQWRCEEEVKIPTGNSVETCSRCVNASREPQPVSIAKVEQSVRTGGSVMLCPTRAWVSDR